MFNSYYFSWQYFYVFSLARCEIVTKWNIVMVIIVRGLLISSLRILPFLYCYYMNFILARVYTDVPEAARHYFSLRLRHSTMISFKVSFCKPVLIKISFYDVIEMNSVQSLACHLLIASSVRLILRLHICKIQNSILASSLSYILTLKSQINYILSRTRKNHFVFLRAPLNLHSIF